MQAQLAAWVCCWLALTIASRISGQVAIWVDGYSGEVMLVTVEGHRRVLAVEVALKGMSRTPPWLSHHFEVS